MDKTKTGQKKVKSEETTEKEGEWRRENRRKNKKGVAASKTSIKKPKGNEEKRDEEAEAAIKRLWKV